MHSFNVAYIPKIETALNAYTTFNLTDTRHTLENAMHYSTMGKSKRFRPLICIASHHLFSSDTDAIMPMACAIELIHTYSLIHDDLPAMDDDILRRGQPTCHIKFGEDTAILAGDTLQAYAFELMATHLTPHFNATCILQAISYIAKASGILGMSGGQVLDLNADPSQHTDAYLSHTHQLKTGALIQAAITAPAILAKATDEIHHHLTAFGHHLGLLFQITDDIIDVTSTTEQLGKSANKDTDQNKLTYVQFWGLDGAKKQATIHATTAIEHLQALDYDTSILRAFVDTIRSRKS